MNPELIKLLIPVALQAFEAFKGLKTSDPAEYEAILQSIGSDHAKALARLEAAAAP